MGIGEELEKLKALHAAGDLSDEEFAAAKAKALSEDGDDPLPTDGSAAGIIRELTRDDRSLGEAANRYVSLQTVMAVVGIILFLIMLFGVILPRMDSGPQFPGSP